MLSFHTNLPEEAHGDHNDALVQRVPANVFQGVEQIEVGMRFLADTDQGPIPVEVTEVDGDEVVVDGNHVAGQTLTFDVEVVSVREATAEEIGMVTFTKQMVAAVVTITVTITMTARQR